MPGPRLISIPAPTGSRWCSALHCSPAAWATTRTTRRSARSCSRITARTRVGTATGCCSPALTTPPCTANTATRSIARSATARRWASPGCNRLRGGTMGAQRRRFGAAVAVGLLVSASGSACGAETAGLYQAYWAGLPAGDIRLVLRDDPTGYRDEIAIRSEGLAWLFTKFRGTATAEGRLAADRPPSPNHYEARYDLRKARDKRLSMQFTARAGAVFAERDPTDTGK